MVPQEAPQTCTVLPHFWALRRWQLDPEVQRCKVGWCGVVTGELPPHLPQLSTACPSWAGSPVRRDWREGFSQVLAHSRPVPGGRSTGIISRSREHVPLWVLRHSSKMSGPKGTAVSAHLETVLGWDAPRVWSPFLPPQNVRCGASTGMGGSQQLALSLQLLLVLLTSCVPHTRCPGPQSQGLSWRGTATRGHLGQGQRPAHSQREQEGELSRDQGRCGCRFQTHKGEKECFVWPRGGEGRTYQRPGRRLLTRLPWWVMRSLHWQCVWAEGLTGVLGAGEGLDSAFLFKT